MLAPTNASGTGGGIAEAAQHYNAFATYLHDTVNAVHSTGANTAGVTGLDFFALDAALPAALGLSVVPTDVDGIATGVPGDGAHNGEHADAIVHLGTRP